jgi:hypothetical protein
LIIGYDCICVNENITLYSIIDDEYYDYFPPELSGNASVSLEDIITHPCIPWDYYWMSRNPNLTAEFIRNNMDKKWDYNALSSNHFKKHVRYVARKPQPKEIIEELQEKFDIPPNVDKRPVFSKGGSWFWENWREMQAM